MRNPVDSVVGWFAPRAGFRRELARVRTRELRGAVDKLRSFEAGQGGRRTEKWRSTTTSVNAETQRSLRRLRARSRDLIQNQAFARKAVAVWTSHLVGTGIRPKAIDGSARARKRIDDTWKAWAVDSTECDVDGRHNFYGLQRIWQREVTEAGEVIVRRRFRPSSAGLTIPMQLQTLEADHLDDSKDGASESGGRIIQGVEFDQLGRPVAYWLFPDHPGETFRSTGRASSVRVPAVDVMHLFRTERAGQVRGIPWGSSCMLTLKDWDSFTDAQLQRQLIATMFVGFVHDIEATDEDTYPAKDGSAKEGNPINLEPGTWEDLPPGKTIDFAKPPPVEGFRDFATVTLAQIAAGFGVTYEDLSGDLSRVNFSSARLGRMNFNAELEEWRELGFNVQANHRAWRWMLEAGELAGALGRPLPATWTAPPPRLVDPATELKVNVGQVRAGFRSWSSVVRSSGQDPEQVLEELAGDFKGLAAKGLTLDSDPQFSTAQGGDRGGDDGDDGDDGKPKLLDSKTRGGRLELEPSRNGSTPEG